MLNLYSGAIDDAPVDDALRSSERQYLELVNRAEVDTVSGRERKDLAVTAVHVFQLFDRPASSPRGIPAAQVPGTEARYARGWTADSPPRGTARDPREAAYWYGLAAQGQETRALSQLARLLALGQGVSSDPDGAALLWWLAAMRGDTAAMFNLGALHERGIGTSVNRSTAGIGTLNRATASPLVCRSKTPGPERRPSRHPAVRRMVSLTTGNCSKK